jgi:hypothetical protein
MSPVMSQLFNRADAAQEGTRASLKTKRCPLFVCKLNQQTSDVVAGTCKWIALTCS